MYFKVTKRLFLHKSFILLPLIICLSDRKSAYTLMLLFAFLHEMAHLLTAKLLRKSGERLFVSPCGFELRLKSAAPGGEALIYLSGPLLSLFLAAVFYFLRNQTLFKINAALFIFNMLPALPLDGGRLLKLWLWKTAGAYRGNCAIKNISRICAVILIILAFLFHSVWLLIAATLIFSKTKRLTQTPFYKKRCNVVPVKPFYFSYNPPLLHLLRLFSPYFYTIVYIQGKNRPVTETEIIKYAEENGCDSRFI
ncbi:MAG: site-2 protease family protein [Clostridia bacterium]|nr:site-2 protease family protein [Clostridia bacterium]